MAARIRFIECGPVGSGAQSKLTGECGAGRLLEFSQPADFMSTVSEHKKPPYSVWNTVETVRITQTSALPPTEIMQQRPSRDGI